MTVKEFYEAMGRAGDYKTREKIEKAVMIQFKLSWRDELDDKAAQIIVDAK